MNHKSTLWAHTMVKNEARWLWYSVNSVIDHVDKLLLWDTGSTDGSIEIEKELVRKYPNKIVFKQSGFGYINGAENHAKDYFLLHEFNIERGYNE